MTNMSPSKSCISLYSQVKVVEVQEIDQYRQRLHLWGSRVALADCGECGECELYYSAVLGTFRCPFPPALPIIPSSLTIPPFSIDMSTVPSTSTLHSNFVPIFDAALETYKRKTKKDLASHPLLPSLQSCDSPQAILTVLREQIPTFSQSQNGFDGLTKWVTPTVTVLHAVSASPLGKSVALVIEMFPLKDSRSDSDIFFQASPPAHAIFAGIGVLLLVSVIHVSFMRPILTPMDPRQ